MGRELAAVCGRWSQLVDHPVLPEVVAVADPQPAARDWFRRVATVQTFADDWRPLLDDDSIDVLYLAVPHHLHEDLYIAAAEAGKDYLAEKPFGIDVGAADRIAAAISGSDSFVRVSSEFPFFPGALRAYAYAASGALGDILEVRSQFAHSSDLDRSKPINWKRQTKFCGAAGVMNDLGLHAWHIPLRLGWLPTSLHATLQDLVTHRPGPDGTMVICDTIENATVTGTVELEGYDFPLTVQTKRIAPGDKNTWGFRVVGLDGAVKFSTKYPKTILILTTEPQPALGALEKEQRWQRVEAGSQSVWPTVTGGIFETGFSDAILQMWAAFLAEREGALGQGFGCVTPGEAWTTHRLYEAALESQAGRKVVEPRLA
jgi:predicted dehydrogenase